MKEKINILVTLDKNYVPRLNVMLTSLLASNPECSFDVYLLHSSMKEENVRSTRALLKGSGELILIQVDDSELKHAPTTSRYPTEIYYRIFAARYLPETVDRVLYLDPDLIVNGSVWKLYNLPLDGRYYAAASHNGKLLRAVNGIRLDMGETSPYINSGVMLMNLELLRKEQDYRDVFSFIEKRKSALILPDQDIISSLYGEKILALDPFRYNMTELLLLSPTAVERRIDLDWVRKNSVIIHYCGRNKPWKEHYIGKLDVFYRDAEEKMKEKEKWNTQDMN